MLFADPAPAIAIVHGIIGGRLEFAVWTGTRGNPWAGAFIDVARSHLGLPPRDPRAAGPFASSDAAYLCTLLANGGWKTVRFTP